MIILTIIIAFLAGIAIGGFIVYKMENKQINDLVDRCSDANKRLEDLLKQEEDFMESMWPKKNPHIAMGINVADYLRDKYLRAEGSEDRDWSDCEDESDNLYM